MTIAHFEKVDPIQLQTEQRFLSRLQHHEDFSCPHFPGSIMMTELMTVWNFGSVFSPEKRRLSGFWAVWNVPARLQAFSPFPIAFQELATEFIKIQFQLQFWQNVSIAF